MSSWINVVSSNRVPHFPLSTAIALQKGDHLNVHCEDGRTYAFKCTADGLVLHMVFEDLSDEIEGE